MDSTYGAPNKGVQKNVKKLVYGLLLITLLFSAYIYLYSASTAKNNNETTLSFLENKLYEIFSRFEDTPGEIDDFAAMDVRDPDNVAGANDDRSQWYTASSTWMARDYKVGDIKPDVGQYTVKSGDTLWEIAEAVYGSGFEWRRILDANKDSVGFLPNGSQALIVPGQTLNIPQ
jgi:nucleoid-associated protein YgaU